MGSKMFARRKDPKKEFWRWLEHHRRDILREIEGTSAFRTHVWSIDELGRRLHDIDHHLGHEIGMADPSTIELIVSADGVKSAFPAVIELVASAPPLKGFKVTAFKPRCPDGMTLHASGQVVTDDLLSYRLISTDDDLGIEVFIDCDLDQETLTKVGFLSLDQRLGEYDVATGLTWIEFALGRPLDAAPITHLAQDFDGRRGQTTH